MYISISPFLSNSLLLDTVLWLLAFFFFFFHPLSPLISLIFVVSYPSPILLLGLPKIIHSTHSIWCALLGKEGSKSELSLKSDHTLPQMDHPACSFSSLWFMQKTEHTGNRALSMLLDNIFYTSCSRNLQLQPATLIFIIPSVCSFKTNYRGLEK